MSFSIVHANRRPNSARRRPGPRAIDVESLEGRALLTSAAVTAAVASLEQAKTDVQSQISSEIATLKSNIVTIEQATTSFISTLPSGDKTDTKLAIRDEKYAIGQQNFLIRELQTTEKQYDSTLNYAISGVKKGKIDPAYVPDVISTGSSNLQAEISTVDSTATSEYTGLIAVFNAGNT